MTEEHRATLESWILRAQISLAEGQLQVARIQLEAALQALYADAGAQPSQAQAGEAFPYQKTFNAIAAATHIEGGMHIAISVSKFIEAFGPASPVASNERDAKDAARYRWVRREHFPTADKPPLAQVVWKAFDDRHSSDWANIIDGNDLDRAIDAALSQQPAKGE